MVSLDPFQLDWVWNHLGDTPLGMLGLESPGRHTFGDVGFGIPWETHLWGCLFR